MHEYEHHSAKQPEHTASTSFRDTDSRFLLELLKRQPSEQLIREVVMIAMGRAMGNEFDIDSQELFFYAYALQEEYEMDVLTEIETLETLYESS